MKEIRASGEKEAFQRTLERMVEGQRQMLRFDNLVNRVELEPFLNFYLAIRAAQRNVSIREPSRRFVAIGIKNNNWSRHHESSDH